MPLAVEPQALPNRASYTSFLSIQARRYVRKFQATAGDRSQRFGVRHRDVVGRKLRTTLQAILGGQSDAGIAFSRLIAVLVGLDFELRVRGDLHILWKDGIPEIINLQPVGSKAKPYQVKQVRAILSSHGLGFDNE